MSALHIPVTGLLPSDMASDRATRRGPWTPQERQLDPIDAIRGLGFGVMIAAILWIAMALLLL